MLKKKLWRICTNFWINPHNCKLPSRLAPAQCQNSLTPQLLSNIYWSKTKTSISLNRVYWYDTMCHIFSCLNLLCSANLYIPFVLSFVVLISLYITSLIIFHFTYILNCSIVLSSCICSRRFASLFCPCICCLFVAYLHHAISLHLLPICGIFASHNNSHYFEMRPHAT